MRVRMRTIVAPRPDLTCLLQSIPVIYGQGFDPPGGTFFFAVISLSRSDF